MSIGDLVGGLVGMAFGVGAGVGGYRYARFVASRFVQQKHATAIAAGAAASVAVAAAASGGDAAVLGWPALAAIAIRFALDLRSIPPASLAYAVPPDAANAAAAPAVVWPSPELRVRLKRVGRRGAAVALVVVVSAYAWQAYQLRGMASIPAGTFVMGSDDSADEDDRPAHEVSLRDFAIDVTEVTSSAYAQCVRAGKCPTASTYVPACTFGKTAKAAFPINCVDWTAATAYCAWVGKRLPTEEEWEYAARGGDRRDYPWGNTVPLAQLCWKHGNRFDATADVVCRAGAFPESDSPFGLHDMAGNVTEWTSTLSPHRGISLPSMPFRHLAQAIVRGGAWSDVDPAEVAAWRRDHAIMGEPSAEVGFRCAR